MKNYLLLPAVFTLYFTNPLFTCAQSHETPPQQNANGQRIDTDTLKEDISDDLIELEVEGIYDADMSALVRLVEKDSDNKWCLIMVIGECEATAMVRAMNEFESNRPLTYDLMNTIFTESSLTCSTSLSLNWKMVSIMQCWLLMITAPFLSWMHARVTV